METTKTTVEMSAKEAEEFAAFKAAQAKKQAEAKRKADEEAYKTLVDEAIESAIPTLTDVSAAISAAKKSVIEQFGQAMEIKGKLYDVSADQRSHTFTNAKGDKRIILGNYTIDGYRDTVEEGIAMVREAIECLGKDDESRALVNAVFRLLSRDQKGTLKASRVLQLEKLAIDSRNERLIQGVQIIKDSYQPTISKQYVRAELKNADGKWIPVSLGMTEAEV